MEEEPVEVPNVAMTPATILLWAVLLVGLAGLCAGGVVWLTGPGDRAGVRDGE